MPPVRSLVSNRRAYIVAVILLFNKIMPIYSCYTKKKLVYIIIITLFSCQPSSYFKYTKSNIYLFCDVRSALDTKYAFFSILSLSYLDSGITQRYAALLAYYCIL